MRLFSPTLLVLAAVALVVGTAEFVAIGILPQVADDLGVSAAAAGTTVSLYALAVGVTALPLARALAGRRPRVLLPVLLLTFATGNLVAAAAPTLPVLLVGRVVSASAQGVALGVATAVAAQLVSPELRGKAVSLVFGGLMGAMFLGAPLGTLLGGLAGWRSPFWLLTVLGVLLALALARFVPASTQGEPDSAGSLSALRRREVLVPIGVAATALLTTSLLFPYLGAYLEQVGGVGPAGVSLGLAAFGVAGLAGNALGGFLSGRRDDVAIAVLAGVVVLALSALAAAGGSWAVMLPALLVWGVAQMSLLPIVTTQVVRHGGSLGATANVAAVNLGIAAGGAVGGLVVDADVTLLPWAAAAGVAVLAVALTARAVGGARRPAAGCAVGGGEAACPVGGG